MSRAKLDTPPVIVPIKLTLHPGEDDDLIDWFAGTPARLRSAAVKAALRGGASLTTAATAIDDSADLLAALIG